MQIILLILKIIGIVILIILLLLLLILIIPFKYLIKINYDGNDLLVDINYIVFHFNSYIHFKEPVKIICKLNGHILVDTTNPKKIKNSNGKEPGKDTLKNNNFIRNLDIKKAVSESRADAIALFRRAKEYQLGLNGKKENKKIFINSIGDIIIAKIKKVWPKDKVDALRIVISEVKKCLRTLLPKNINTKLKIGFNNPFYTGVALAVLSPIFAIMGKEMEVTPSYSKEEVSGVINLSGNLALIIPLMSIIKLLLNKDVREVVFNEKKHKKKLKS